MKSSELMIGDLINGFGVGRKVTGIYGCERPEDDGMLTTMVPGCEFPESNLSFRPSYASPIPLTAEMLEKNGFNVENTRALLELRSGRVLINTIRLPEYGEADVKATGYNTERYCGMFVRLEKTIKYVHELQQIMRMCGIEKEVVL